MPLRDEAGGRAGLVARSDTVTNAADTVIGLHEQSPDTVKVALEPRLLSR